MNDDTLRAWLDRAHEQHAQRPREVADALLARAATLPADAEGAEAVQLGEHLLLGHLADGAALQRLLALLPPAAALEEARTRAAWALRQWQRAEGGPQPDVLPEAPAWRAMQNVTLAWVQQGRVADAAAWWQAHEAQALGNADASARRAFAAGANNLASHLRDGPRGSAERDKLMLQAAAIARRAWAAAGTWLQVERAEYQLALCHAAVGDGAMALRHALACVSVCEAEGADAVERFFAHEALARAQHAAGDAAAADAACAQMHGLLAQCADAGLAAWCREVLATTEADTGRTKEKAG